MRPCKCDKQNGGAYTPEQCWTCWKYHNDPLYKELWDREDLQPVKKIMNVECPMRGAQVQDEKGILKEQDCEACGGKTRLKVFYCQHPAREPDQVTMQDCRSCVYRPKNPEAKPIILRNFLSPGDVTCMSASIYSLHKQHPDKFLTAVDTSCNAVYENNPDVIPLSQAKEMGAQSIEMHYPEIQECNQVGIHFMGAYCNYLESVLNVRIPLKTNRPHLYLSRREKSWMDQVNEATGKKTPFWIINSGYKRDYSAKFWPHYQALVNQTQGRILFVQVGKTEHVHRPLKGVINLLDKTDDRQLIRLVSHCDGVVCGTTWLMHLSAAFEKPSFILAGGREPRQWNQYPRSHLYSMVGMLPCCQQSCWRSRTVKIGDGDSKDGELCEFPTPTDPPSPKCMAMIQPEEVATKILQFHG